MDIAIDNARNILYTLSQSSVIQVYDLGTVTPCVFSVKQSICECMCLCVLTNGWDITSRTGTDARSITKGPAAQNIPKEIGKIMADPVWDKQVRFLAVWS